MSKVKKVMLAVGLLVLESTAGVVCVPIFQDILL